MSDYLIRALESFGTDELLSFIPQSGRDIILQLSESNSEVEVDKKKLAHVVRNTHAERILSDVSLRKRIIDRFDQNVLQEVFPQLLSDVHAITPAHYEICQQYADKYIEDFASAIGLEDAYYALSNKNIKKPGIKRIRPAFSLFSYQADISSEVLRCLQSGEKKVLIHLPTGAGKTRTAMNIVAEHLRENPSNLVVWLADREELCQQAFDTFVHAWQALGKHECSAYGLYSDSNESLGGVESGFLVAGLQKLISLRRNNDAQLNLLYKILRREATLVVFDEAHKAIAPEFNAVIGDFIYQEEFEAPLIGLTATPGRKFSVDGLSDEDYRLSQFFDGKKITMSVTGYLSPVEYLVKNGYLAKAEIIPLNYDQSDVLGYHLQQFKSRQHEVLNFLAENESRNSVLLDTIMEEAKQGSQIIVFAASVEHANKLASILTYMGVQTMSVDSKNDNLMSRRTKIAKYLTKKIQVITNYNVLTAGFDAPSTNVVIIARPVQSLVQYMQMAGRAMRGEKSNGNKHCRIYTVMDDIPEFKSVCKAFEYWDEMWTEGDDNGS